MPVLGTDFTPDPAISLGSLLKKYLLTVQKGGAWPKVTGLQNWTRAQTSPRGFPLPQAVGGREALALWRAEGCKFPIPYSVHSVKLTDDCMCPQASITAERMV